MNQLPLPIRRVRQRRLKTQARPQLNLVALMDVFTLLVFFFLVHSADVADPANARFIDLPESVANHVPRETLVVTITREQLLVGDQRVALVDSILHAPDDAIVPLEQALRKGRQAQDAVSSNVGEAAREVTIMGDRTIPFRLLKKVMLTCTRAGFSRISLAVIQRSVQSG